MQKICIYLIFFGKYFVLLYYILISIIFQSGVQEQLCHGPVGRERVVGRGREDPGHVAGIIFSMPFNLEQTL